MKMKFQNAFFLLSGAAALAWTGCTRLNCLEPSGSIVTKEVTITGTDELELNNEANVSVVKDSTYRITIKAPQNLVDNTTLTKSGTRLRIGGTRCVNGSADYQITVHMPAVRNLVNTGSGHITTPDVFSAELFQVLISGSGDVQFRCDATNTKATVSGSGDLNLESTSEGAVFVLSGSGDVTWKGTSETLNAALSGSGDLKAFDAPVKEATVTVSGSGSADVKVTQKLTANLSGSGNLNYKGTPVITSTVTGSGRVRNAN